MSIGSRIKEARNYKGFTQEELANQIGVTKGAIANYENQVSIPKIEILTKLMSILDCDANYLYQDESPKTLFAPAPNEISHIKKYRQLDVHGKDVVDLLLDKELERCQEKNVTIFPQPNKSSENWKSFVGMPVAARGGMKLTDETEARWLANLYENFVKPEMDDKENKED